MRLILVLLMGILAMSSVSAATINANGPADGVVQSPDDTKFSFTVDSYTVIQECKLVIDDEVVKNLQYNRLIPSSILWSYKLDEGVYEWHVACTTEDNEVLETIPRTITIEVSKEAEVSVVPSGTGGGSYRFSFDFQNTDDQQPALLKDIAPGDFIEISLYVPPSRIKQEFFVRRMLETPEKGKYFVLDHKSKTYNVHIGENTTLPVGSSQVYATISSVKGIKADMVFYPYYTVSSPPETPEEPEEQPQEEPETSPNEATETPEEPEEQPQEEPPKEEPVQEPENNEPKQNALQRILSWLVNIFGR